MSKIDKNMPMKDLTSSNEHPFALSRNMFTQISQIEQAKTLNTSKQKKFYGNSSNRDASAVTTRRGINQASSTFSLNGQMMSNQSVRDVNDTRQALRRVRSGGSTVPAKKTHQYENARVFYPGTKR